MDSPAASTDGVLTTDLHVQATYVLTEALVASESRMRRRLELLSEVIFETDAAERLVFLNGAWGMTLGYDPRECLGTLLTAYVVEEDLPLLSQVLRVESHAGGRLQPRLRLRRLDGSMVWMEVSATALEGGGWVGALHNVTRQKEAQDEIAKLSMVASFTDSMVIIADRLGGVEWVNRAFLEKTGYRMAEVTGAALAGLLKTSATDPQTGAHIDRCLREERAFQCELMNYTKEGEPYWVSVYVSPVHNDQGLEHYVCVQADTTQLKRTQQQLEAAKESAEAATEGALEASRLKSEFLANMSHEVRTPMNGIIAMVWLVLQSELSDEQREYMDIIRTSADSLLVLLNDILDFSKIEAGRLALEKTEFQPREVVENTVRLMEPEAARKGLKLIADLGPGLPTTLMGDPHRIQQVINNLVGNAVKFTEHGWIRIAAAIEGGEGNSVLLHCSVEDTGIGIPVDKQPLIFEAFTQADGSVTRRYGGTGLGLTISSRLVSLFGGRIWVRSEVDKGSTFHFTARLERAEVQPGSSRVA